MECHGYRCPSTGDGQRCGTTRRLREYSSIRRVRHLSCGLLYEEAQYTEGTKAGVVMSILNCLPMSEDAN